MEALASGLPVVISDQVPIHREVTDASAGLVVRCQVKELTEALLKLLQDASLRSAMASNGRRLAQTKFSPEAVTDRLITLYRDLC